MAGGAGTRFWPISTADVPKQYLNVGNTGKTFIQQTVARFNALIPAERVIVVGNANHEEIIRRQLPDIPSENILLEPYKRDTAPCVAYAALSILKRDPDAVMVVVPSDHIIMDVEGFCSVIEGAVAYVKGNDVLMTIGITPTRPDTNYGYIQASQFHTKGTPVAVKTFTEKPDADLARVFIQSGEFLWNSGIFVWKAETIIKQYEKFLPQMAAQFNGWQTALGTVMEQDFIEKAYADCLKISVDYGIMEKTDDAWVYPAEFGWYDIGTFESMYSFIQEKDASGNASNVRNMLMGCKNNLILSTDPDKLVAVCDLEGYVVVDTGKALLVCPREDKRLREFLSNLAMPEFESYR